MRLTYVWLHIPTGKKGERTINCLSLNDAHDKISEWNRRGAGEWQYWATVTIGG